MLSLLFSPFIRPPLLFGAIDNKFPSNTYSITMFLTIMKAICNYLYSSLLTRLSMAYKCLTFVTLSLIKIIIFLDGLINIMFTICLVTKYIHIVYTYINVNGKRGSESVCKLEKVILIFHLKI